MRISEVYSSIQVGTREALLDKTDLLLIEPYRWYVLDSRRGGIYLQGYKEYKGKQPNWILMHQLIMDAKWVDHRDGNGLNNRRDNLRLTTPTLNQANSKKRPGSSQYKGVTWDAGHGKWKAKINKHYKRTFLGLYIVEEDAAQAYDDAARQMFGEFARLNFPTEGEASAHQ